MQREYVVSKTTASKTAKHNLPLGVKTTSSGTQPIFAVVSSARSAAHIAAASVVSNSKTNVEPTHSVEEFAMQTSEDFQVVTNKKAKRLLNASSTDDPSDDDTHIKTRPVNQSAITGDSADASGSAQLSTTAINETLYIKGVGYNFAAAVRRQPFRLQCS
jgi:hypothetical protein